MPRIISPDHATITPEHARVFQLLRRAMQLRDKYITKSLQRLGDNPRDHDGHFHGISEGYADVAGVKPKTGFSNARVESGPHQPWKIYPKPPPPHWHFSPKTRAATADGLTSTEEEFDFDQCQVPGPQESSFKLDDKGVYQVYSRDGGSCCPTSVISCSDTQQISHCLISHPFENTSLISTLCFQLSPMVQRRA